MSGEQRFQHANDIRVQQFRSWWRNSSLVPSRPYSRCVGRPAFVETQATWVLAWSDFVATTE